MLSAFGDVVISTALTNRAAGEIYISSGLSVIGGLDYWNGLLEWTTGMDFDLFFFFSFSQELTLYIEELV